MSTHSGTPYLREEVNKLNTDSIAFQPTLADLIAKLEALTHDMAHNRADLHETKVQVKNICRESTAGENSSSSQNRRDNTDNPSNLDDQFLKNIKIDGATFDRRHDPQFFLNWTHQLDKYFTWYNLTKPEKIKFTFMKLTGQASQY